MATTGSVLVRSGRGQRVQLAGRDGERPIERIGATVCADDIAQARVRDGADHRPSLGRIAGAPADGKARRCLGLGMGGKTNMARPVRRRHGLYPEENEPSPNRPKGSKGLDRMELAAPRRRRQLKAQSA